MEISSQLNRKNFKILFEKNPYDTDSCFVFKFHGNRPPREVSETMRCFADNKVRKTRFSPPFCARLAQGAKRLQGSVLRDPTSPYKISSQSVPICRSYSQKRDFIRSHMPRHIIISLLKV